MKVQNICKKPIPNSSIDKAYAVAGIKVLLGAMLGKTMDDSIEGKLKV